MDRIKELEDEIVRLRNENEKFKVLLRENTNPNKVRKINYLDKSFVKDSSFVDIYQIFEKNLSVMLLIDPGTGQIVNANESAVKFYGYSRENILNMKISDINILHKEEVKKEMERAVKSNKNVFNFKHRLHSGEIRDVLVTSDPVNIDGNNYLFSIIFDITDKVTEIRYKEKKYKQMFNNINEMMVVFRLNKDGTPSKFLEANEEVCKRLGYSYEEILELSPIEVDKNEPNIVMEKVMEMKYKNLMNFKTRLITKYNTCIQVEINTYCFELNDEDNILVVAKDVSKRKKIERNLMKSIKEQEKLLSYLPAAIFIVDKNKILSVNEYGRNLLGYDLSEQLVGKDYLNTIVHPDYHEKVRARHKINKLDAPLIEKKYLKKNGEVVDVEVTALKIPYENGSAFLIFATNISELKSIRNELDEMNHVEKLRTDFFANISHELRTPLNVILGSLQLQEFYLNKEEPGSNTKKYKKIHERTKRNCYRLLRLVNNLIDITKIDSGFYEADFQNYDIVQLIKTIVISMEDYVTRQNLKIEFISGVECLKIACDPEKLERVILNLLSNSIKFTGAGGKITVKIEIVDDKVQITVKDSGIGIPKEKQKVIFDRFVQVDKTLTRKHEGSGIGLSLVKSLVELHEGNISLKSNLGDGTEFNINLPIRNIIENGEQLKGTFYESFNIERMHIEFSDIYFK